MAGNWRIRAGLSPWPVPWPSEAAKRGGSAFQYGDLAQYSNWGEEVTAGQEVVEATPFRVVLCGWRLGREVNASHSDKSGTVGHFWQYTVYPSGRVYVRVRSRLPGEVDSRGRLAYAIAVNGGMGFQYVSPDTVGRSDDADSFVLLARTRPGNADLLWSWAGDAGLRWQHALPASGERQSVDGLVMCRLTMRWAVAHCLRFLAGRH